MLPPRKPPEKKVDFQRPNVVFQPATARGLERGINQILNAVNPTLGPLPRMVAIEPIANKNQPPEILDSGGTIARRIIQVRGRDADVGAMYIRNVLYSLQEKAGDGTATAAVIFQKLYNEGRRYVVNGGNPMALRNYFEEAVPLVLQELDSMTRRIRGKKALAGLARTITNDDALSNYLGEIFDIIGEFGRLEIRAGRTRELEREYVEGLWWDKGVVSREMIFDKVELRTSFEDAYLLISDLEIENPEDILPLLDLCVANGIKELLLISRTLSDRAIGLLLLKPNLEKIKIAAVPSPEAAMDKRIEALMDIAILTGGRTLMKDAGDTLNNIRLEDLGRARRIWVRADNWGFVGGRGDSRTVRSHIASLRQAYNHARNADDRKRILNRVSKLLGGSATLWVGDNTPTAIEQRKALAERTAEAMRGAMREGVVPGGGVALLNCRTALRKAIADATDPDQAAAYRMMVKACEAPFRTILANSGAEVDEIMPQINHAEPGCGYDVIRRQLCDMDEAGIFDAASVVKAAVHAAFTGAGLALTLDVIVHRKNPPESLAVTS
jgi:chaperonin GroEL